VPGEKAAALRQRDRVRIDAINVSYGNAWIGDEVMADAQQRLLLDLDVVGQQQIKVLRDRTGEAVFNGNGRRVCLA
jgi:hypothetical protein